MRAQVFGRKVHYWLSIVVAGPLLVVLASGLLLQVKKDFHWIQPHEQTGGDEWPRISFDDVLAICARVPDVSVADWDDVDRLDYRPSKNLLKITTQCGKEVQIDPSNGDVLQVAVRRSDVIESLHDGSWFGDATKRLVFLPAGIILAVMWVTGMYLFLLPQLRRRRKPAAGANAQAAARPAPDEPRREC